MDSYSKIVHNVTKFIRVAIEEHVVSIRNDTKGFTCPNFIGNEACKCRVNDNL